MTARRIIVVAFALVTHASFGKSQTVGALIGLAERGSPHGRPDQLVTLWITANATDAARSERLDGLWIPQRTGFRRVRLDRRCTDGSGGIPRHCADTLRVRPAGGWAQNAVRASAEHACTVDGLSVTFASPSLVSIQTTGTRSECWRRSFSDVSGGLTRPWERDSAIRFSAFGADAAATFRRAAAAARNVGAAEGEKEQDETCQADTTSDRDWFIVRQRDRWAAELFQQRGNELCTLTAPIDWTLPSEAVGFPEPRFDWTAVTAVIPDAETAFLSPDSSMSVIVRPSSIGVYAMDGMRPRRQAPLLSYTRSSGSPTDVVMVQWALGAAAARWQALMPLLPHNRRP